MSSVPARWPSPLPRQSRLLLRRRVGCRRPRPAVGGLFGKVYEYEEDLYLSLDGSAELIVNASIPALVTLRGLDLPLDPAAQARPRRDPRRVHVAADRGHARQPAVAPARAALRADPRCASTDIRKLTDAAPVLVVARTSWPRRTALVVYRQTCRRISACGRARSERRLDRRRARRVPAPPAEQDRLAQRARPRDQRAKRHRARKHPGVGAAPDRSARRTALSIEVRMDRQSILHRTLWLFAGAFLPPSSSLRFVWLTIRKGARKASQPDFIVRPGRPITAASRRPRRHEG